MSVLENSQEGDIRFSNADAGDFIALLKPRVMSLVVFTALTGIVIAPGQINPVVAFASLLAITVGAGASGALNQWYESDIDAVMSRTKSRPIPAGKVTSGEALNFGVILSILSVMMLGLFANWLSAALLAFTILYYAVFYTMWLKRATPQNIVIGGAAGAFPPMIGWATVTGTVSIESVVLFLIIFFWTPPHFWALALFKAKDYTIAGVPMMPNVAGERSTKRQMFAYTLIVAPVGVLPWFMGFGGLAYGVVSTVLGAAFIWYAWQVLQMPESDRVMVAAKKLFKFSILYLFALFATLLGETLVGKMIAMVA